MMKTDDCSMQAGAIAAKPGKYLTYVLGGESYGMGIQHVREIIRPPAITPVPRMPSHIRGVINLRGKVIPVLDLARKFGLACPSENPRACIVVVQTQSPSSAPVLTGLLVDAVEEVMTFSAENLTPAPDFGGRLDTRHLVGMAKAGPKVKILLDIERVVSDDATPA